MSLLIKCSVSQNLRINVFIFEIESIDNYSKTMKERFLLYRIRYKAQNKSFKITDTLEKMGICVEKLCEKREKIVRYDILWTLLCCRAEFLNALPLQNSK